MTFVCKQTRRRQQIVKRRDKKLMELIVALAHDRVLRRERVFRDRLDPLSVSDEHLLRYYRFPRRDIIWLCQELQQDIGRVTRRTYAVPTHTSVLLALRFFCKWFISKCSWGLVRLRSSHYISNFEQSYTGIIQKSKKGNQNASEAY